MKVMMSNNIPPSLANSPTRRQLFAGLAVAFGSFAAASEVWGIPQQPDIKEVPSKPENRTRTSLHMELEFAVAPQRIYEALLDSKQFTAFSGMPAEIDRKEGGAFSMFGGMIVGRNIELIPNQRIVQAWRPAHWYAGIFSIVKFELKPNGSGTIYVLDHKGFPEGDFDSLTSGWKEHYAEPLKKFLA